MKNLFRLLALAFGVVLTSQSDAKEAKKTKAKNILKVKNKKIQSPKAVNTKVQRLTPVEELKNSPPVVKSPLPENGKIEMKFANEIPIERPAE